MEQTRCCAVRGGLTLCLIIVEVQRTEMREKTCNMDVSERERERAVQERAAL